MVSKPLSSHSPIVSTTNRSQIFSASNAPQIEEEEVQYDESKQIQQNLRAKHIRRYQNLPTQDIKDSKSNFSVNYYNLNKKDHRRDLQQIALHKHPKAHVLGILRSPEEETRRGSSTVPQKIPLSKHDKLLAYGLSNPSDRNHHNLQAIPKSQKRLVFPSIESTKDKQNRKHSLYESVPVMPSTQKYNPTNEVARNESYLFQQKDSGLRSSRNLDSGQDLLDRDRKSSIRLLEKSMISQQQKDVQQQYKNLSLGPLKQRSRHGRYASSSKALSHVPSRILSHKVSTKDNETEVAFDSDTEQSAQDYIRYFRKAEDINPFKNQSHKKLREKLKDLHNSVIIPERQKRYGKKEFKQAKFESTRGSQDDKKTEGTVSYRDFQKGSPPKLKLLTDQLTEQEQKPEQVPLKRHIEKAIQIKLDQMMKPNSIIQYNTQQAREMYDLVKENLKVFEKNEATATRLAARKHELKNPIPEEGPKTQFSLSNLRKTGEVPNYSVDNAGEINVDKQDSQRLDTDRKSDFSRTFSNNKLPQWESNRSLTVSPDKKSTYDVESRGSLSNRRKSVKADSTSGSPGRKKSRFSKKQQVHSLNKQILEDQNAVEKRKKKFQKDVYDYLKLDDQIKVFSLLRRLRHDFKNLALRDAKLKGYEGTFPKDKEEQLEEMARSITKMSLIQSGMSAEAIEEGFLDAGMFEWWEQMTHEMIVEMFKQKNNEEIDEEYKAFMLHLESREKDKNVHPLRDIRIQQLQTLLESEGAQGKRALIDYVRYLMRQSNNKDFVYNEKEYEQKHELNQLSIAEGFDEYVQQEENAMKTVANDIIERLNNHKIGGQLALPISVEVLSGNPKYEFLKSCYRSELVLPLLTKVANKKLSLRNYLLGMANVKALGDAMQFNKDFVTKFYFDNCGLTDAHTELLLQSMQRLSHAQQFVTKRNEFGPKSLLKTQELLTLNPHRSLKILRIVNCKTTGTIMTNLITLLKESDHHIKVLALVNAKIPEQSMNSLADMVEDSDRLKELDLSWNVMRPRSYAKLLTALSKNRQLTYINLSYNTMIDQPEEKVQNKSKPVSPKGGGSLQQRKQSQATNKSGALSQRKSSRNADLPGQEKVPEDPLEFAKCEVKYTPHTQHMIECLQKMIKHNTALQHISLQKIGLTERMLCDLGSCLTRAKAMMTIHLCGNKGVTDRVKEFLHTRIRCKTIQNKNDMKSTEEFNQIFEQTAKKILMEQLFSHKVKKDQKEVAAQIIKVKQVQERKRLESLQEDFGDSDVSKLRLQFQRILGHKKDIKGSAQWKLMDDKQDNCWISNQDIYSLIFWNRDIIGEKAMKKQNVFSVRSIQEQMHKFSSEAYEDQIAEENPGVPILIGDFTNWKPVPMISLITFSEAIYEQMSDQKIIAALHKEKLLPQEGQTSFKDLTADSSKYRFAQAAKRIKFKILDEWKETISRWLRFKKPHLVDAKDVLEHHTEYYTDEDEGAFSKRQFVFPWFLQPGKHSYMVRYGKKPNGTPMYFYHTTISDIRPEEIPVYIKEVNVGQKAQRVFIREKSVFKPWQIDTTKIYDGMVNFDKQHWKLNKIIKDETDLTKTIAFIREHIDYLKDVYLQLATNSNYPYVGFLEVQAFTQDINLITADFPLSQCDVFYTSCEQKSIGGLKNKKGLMRCEFIEFLVRLANGKYSGSKSSRGGNSFLSSLETLLDHMKKNFKLKEWQSWRERELWTLDVADVLDANIIPLKKLHTHYIDKTIKYFSMENAKQILEKDSPLLCTIVQTKYCIGYCQTTVVDEIEENLEYLKLDFVEFLEMIGRLAQIYFAGEDRDSDPLPRKVEHILDAILPIVGERRKPVVHNTDSESESDDDYGLEDYHE